MSYETALKAAAIVHDAGGRVVGRTRLQKIAYLLSIVGFEDGLDFSYKHYGPYSEDLSFAAKEAQRFDLMSEVEMQASWGGSYSIYASTEAAKKSSHKDRMEFAALAAKADAVELELAATAAFLAQENYEDPWLETFRRKPEKAENGRIEKAKELYRKLSQIRVPKALPEILQT